MFIPWDEKEKIKGKVYTISSAKPSPKNPGRGRGKTALKGKRDNYATGRQNAKTYLRAFQKESFLQILPDSIE